MKYIRWYDKNPDLKDIFEFLEGLDISAQRKVAKEILLILLNDFHLQLDEQINNIAKNYTYSCKRWYDYNIDLFTSFEIIRKLPKKLQKQLIEKIVSSLLQSILNGEFEKKAQ